MQDSRINYVIVGAFVSAVLAAFIVALAMIAGQTGATDDYYTVYDDVTGIKYGTEVLYDGYQIGQVASVKPKPGKKMLFKVNLEVKKGWRIPDDSIAKATVSGLLAAMTIDIRGGKSETFLKPGSEIKGASPSNFFSALADIGSQFGELSNESLKPLLASMNHLVQQLDKASEQDVPAILDDVKHMTAGLAKDTPAISGSVRRSAEIVETEILKPENRGHIDSILTNIDQTSANVAAVTAQLDATRKAINEATNTLNKMIQDNAGNVSEAMRDLRYTMDTLSRYVDDIAQNADATSRNLAEFSRTIREDPGIFLTGSPPPDQAKGK